MSTNVAKYTNSPLVGAFSLLRSSLSRFPRASLPFDKGLLFPSTPNSCPPYFSLTLYPCKMDMSIIDDLQHLRLTKDEEEDIQISTMNRSDLMEECALRLFGKLLTNRQQNQRALKNTLKAAWKMGLDLRIVDVGKNLFQFKFSSGFQLDWVERNGP